LDVYGGGYLEEYVAQFAKTHANVVYHGRVENKEVMQKQREAWLLINPRRVDDLIAKVTFPSKTFEYMLSGTPILTTRLNGYGAEYQDKMFFIEKGGAQGIADAISGIEKKDSKELMDTACRAYEFITKKRTWKEQTQRIIDFL
jgi:glycosyltransferase involved in cell wall biosynthesis